MIKNMAFFYKKPEGLDWETWNFSWRHKRSVVKKHLKIIFYQRSPSLSKCNLKYENICLLDCSSPNIWAVVYIIVFNSSPQFYSHLSCSLLRLKLILLQILHLQLTVFNSYPNIYQKWNWAAGNLQIFLSEIIIQQENGCCGGNLAWISNSIFTKG